jgi:hypothetical protein
MISLPATRIAVPVCHISALSDSFESLLNKVFI